MVPIVTREQIILGTPWRDGRMSLYVCRQIHITHRCPPARLSTNPPLPHRRSNETAFDPSQPSLLPARRLRFLFPFDCRGRFAADVVDHPIDAGDFIGDAARNPGEQIMGQP